MRSAGEEVQACVGWQKYPSVAPSHVYPGREFFLFPPIVRERNRAPVHCEIDVSEAVAGENPAVV